MGLPDGDKYSRSEKSLSTLTKKFVQMLQVKNILDLNSVSFYKTDLFSIPINFIKDCFAL